MLPVLEHVSLLMSLSAVGRVTVSFKKERKFVFSSLERVASINLRKIRISLGIE